MRDHSANEPTAKELQVQDLLSCNIEIVECQVLKERRENSQVFQVVRLQVLFSDDYSYSTSIVRINRGSTVTATNKMKRVLKIKRQSCLRKLACGMCFNSFIYHTLTTLTRKKKLKKKR